MIFSAMLKMSTGGDSIQGAVLQLVLDGMLIHRSQLLQMFASTVC